MAIQTTYTNKPVLGIEGQLADGGEHDIMPMYNSEASAEIGFGRAVKFGSTSGTDQDALLPTAETDIIAGIVVFDHSHSSSAGGDLGTVGIRPQGMLNVLRKGRILVKCEDGCTPGQRLWVRAVGSTPPEYLGGLNSADDSTDMIDCTNQGVWLTTAAAEGLAVLEVDFTNRPT